MNKINEKSKKEKILSKLLAVTSAGQFLLVEESLSSY